MRKTDQEKPLKIAIVGEDADCKAMMDLLCDDGSRKFGVELIGVGVVNPRRSDYRSSRVKDIYTTENYRDLCELKDLDMIIDLANNPEVTEGLFQAKPDNVHVINRTAVRLFLALFKVQEKRIAEYKRMADSFRKKSENYWRLFDNAVAAMYRTRIEDGSVIMCNEKLARILGYDNRDEVIADYNMADNYADQKERRQLLEQLWQSGRVDYFEFRLKRRDGSIFWACLSARIFTELGYLEGMLMDISERKRAEEQNRFLTRRLLSAQEEERKRIARDLHDELGQALSTLQFGMNALKQAFPLEVENQKERYDTIITQIEHVGDTVRRISSELRPEMLDQLGLFPALEWYIKGFKERNEGIAVDFQFIGFKKRLSPEIEIVLYRVLQEALANIAKHAMASHVSIKLTFSYPTVIFAIKDDGVGFDAELTRMTKDGGIGLLGMRERIDSVGGIIEIRSSPGRGTIIRTTLSVLKDKDSNEQDKCFGSR